MRTPNPRPPRPMTVAEYLDSQPDVRAARLQGQLAKAIVRAGDLLRCTPELFAPVMDADDWESVASIRQRINDWADAMEAARPRLQVVTP